MFPVLRNYVCKTRALKSDWSEHNSGLFRSIIIEFTVMQFNQLVKQIKRIIDANFKGGFQTAKEINKVYLSTLESYIQSNIDSISKDDYGALKIDPNRTKISARIFQEKVQEIMRKTAVTISELSELTVVTN